MRVTSTLFPTTLKNQLQRIQQRQVELQTQSATGLKVQKSSDNPLAYSQIQQADSTQRENSAYLDSTSEAKTMVTTNYNAMSNIAKLLSRASELATQSTGYTDSSSLNSISTEMTNIVEQLVSIANQKSDGNYIFGGTGDVPPITGTSGSYAYNASASYTSNVTKISISSTNVFDAGLVAGQAGGFDGFLYDSGSGADTLDILQTLATQLSGATPAAATSAQLQTLNDCIDLNAQYVGKTAAQLSALELNKSALTNISNANAERISDLATVDMATVLTDLQQTQTYYQAALQTGAKVLTISLLDYIS